jgi:hypothetical protein
MLNFFKRKPTATPTASSKPSGAAPVRARPAAPAGKSVPPAEPAPLPEVREGNLESDWALWEDSVAFQDSQMPSDLSPLEAVKDRSSPKQDDGPDPYSTVRRRG